MFQTFYSHFRQYDFIKAIVHLYNHTKGIRTSLKWYSYLYIYYIVRNLAIPSHENVRKNAQNLLNRGMNIGHFYLAQSLFLQNQLDEADYHATQFQQQYPLHSDGLYLLAEIKQRKKQKTEAFELLQDFLKNSKRRKTWQHLSNLVDTEAEFCRFYNLFVEAYPNYTNQPLTYDLACHLSNAAIRAKKWKFVLELWRNQYCLLNQDQLIKSAPLPKSRRYSDIKAAQALKDLKKHFDFHQIDFFLISGTLLGCIREGKLLGHDKDIDIGVWETLSVNTLADKIYNSGCFYVLPIYSPDILVIRHVNGITIDIFLHYREEKDYWHAGGKSKWHNSPFKLISQPFLNDHYLIPANYDLYLTENYGDWRTPQILFDSALDTPNMEIISQDDFLIYLYKKITFSLHTGKRPSERYLSILRKYGEHLD